MTVSVRRREEDARQRLHLYWGECIYYFIFYSFIITRRMGHTNITCIIYCYSFLILQSCCCCCCCCWPYHCERMKKKKRNAEQRARQLVACVGDALYSCWCRLVCAEREMARERERCESGEPSACSDADANVSVSVSLWVSLVCRPSDCVIFLWAELFMLHTFVRRALCCCHSSCCCCYCCCHFIIFQFICIFLRSSKQNKKKKRMKLNRKWEWDMHDLLMLWLLQSVLQLSRNLPSIAYAVKSEHKYSKI